MDVTKLAPGTFFASRADGDASWGICRVLWMDPNGVANVALYDEVESHDGWEPQPGARAQLGHAPMDPGSFGEVVVLTWRSLRANDLVGLGYYLTDGAGMPGDAVDQLFAELMNTPEPDLTAPVEAEPKVEAVAEAASEPEPKPEPAREPEPARRPWWKRLLGR